MHILFKSEKGLLSTKDNPRKSEHRILTPLGDIYI
jgi:hypothetical protein